MLWTEPSQPFYRPGNRLEYFFDEFQLLHFLSFPCLCRPDDIHFTIKYGNSLSMKLKKANLLVNAGE